MKIYIHYSNDRDVPAVVSLHSTLALAEESVREANFGVLIQDSIASMELDRPDSFEWIV